MTVPTYDNFIEPLLRYLEAHPSGVEAKAAHEAAPTALNLPAEDREQLLPSGTQRIYKNRAGWAHDRLKRAGLSSSPRRGFWKLTPEGMAFATQRTEPFSAELLLELATGHNDVRLRDAGSSTEINNAPRPEAPSQLITASPDDRLEEALAEIRRTVSAEVLEALRQVSPTFFETIVLDVLHRMGYGASRADLQ